MKRHALCDRSWRGCHHFIYVTISTGIGGVTKSMTLLEPYIQREIDRCAMPPYHETPVGLAELGDRGGVLGAAALVLGTTDDE